MASALNSSVTESGKLAEIRRTSLRQAVALQVGRDNLLRLVELMLDPAALVVSLLACAYMIGGRITPAYLLLCLLIFSITFPGSAHLRETPGRLVRRIVLNWLGIGALLLFFGYATRYIRRFDIDVMIAWAWLAPLAQVVSHLALRRAAPWIIQLQGEPKRIAIAGQNVNGLELASRIANDRFSNMRVVGFFDDRGESRQPAPAMENLPPPLGKIDDIPALSRNLRLDSLYLSLPMTTQPRILDLLDRLRDTTMSVYFVPDVFVTNLIQGRMDTLCDIPVVAVCESPFTGINGIVKRASDLVMASLILLLLSPLLLLIAICVRLDSPGPVIFRQRRYGLSGDEITVYKFRSMTTCDDGEKIVQATRADPRITRVGAFLRKTSLDELPQFINVLQGRMSIVGPRPHAVAHNELYRKLIKGYMVRHKVRPGITGWAQVNGLRGETDSIEKMSARIEHDLDYMRNWSLSFDLKIILRTLLVVWKDEMAY